jgi:hypothetical protein
MPANTAADALGRFLSSTPETSTPVSPVTNQGELMDKLGRILLPAGDAGLPVADAMTVSNLPRPDFFNALSQAISGGLVETFDNAGVQLLKLTPVGRSLY